ncbi:hypothetical protein [Paenibacillus qinlingensis]|uniref:hypothetical protein n=1 Tax=Paenibacillus qinlingensis TaxID=1837343 RepID=UPI0015659EB4|nr:hypothetical protein [Paenibacillus qinlingensis]NQX60022.1 hypothetical protein [Paenibacillus qinlingensis]
MVNKKKFYKTTWFLWVMMFVVSPVGIILLWLKRQYKPQTLGILSAVFGVYFIVMIVILNQDTNKKPVVKEVKDTPAVVVSSVSTGKPKEESKPEIGAKTTEKPKIKSPEIKAPEVKAPEVKVPEVKVPEVKVPEVKVPEVKVPEVKTPEVKVPEIKVPEIKTPVKPIAPAPSVLKDYIPWAVENYAGEKSNIKNADRIRRIEIDDKSIFIELNADDDITKERIKSDILKKSTAIFKQVFKDRTDVPNVSLSWGLPHQDTKGNEIINSVVAVSLSSDAAKTIDWDKFTYSNLPKAATSYTEHEILRR